MSPERKPHLILLYLILFNFAGILYQQNWKDPTQWSCIRFYNRHSSGQNSQEEGETATAERSKERVKPLSLTVRWTSQLAAGKLSFTKSTTTALPPPPHATSGGLHLEVQPSLACYPHVNSTRLAHYPTPPSRPPFHPPPKKKKIITCHINQTKVAHAVTVWSRTWRPHNRKSPVKGICNVHQTR